MRTQTTTVYTFDELSDKAKDRARDWYRQSCEGDNYWSEAVTEDAARMAAMLGIDLNTRRVPLMGGGSRQEPQIYWSLGGQGSGACFVGSYSYKAGSVKAIAKEAPAPSEPDPLLPRQYDGNTVLNQIARDLAAIQKPHGYRLTAKIEHRGNSCHEYAPSITVYDERTGNETEDEPAAEAVIEALRDFMRWIYRTLECEYEYVNADEQIDDTIRANDYEFTETGARCAPIRETDR